jgi:tRNA (mo5U34)-methyltransferase
LDTTEREPLLEEIGKQKWFHRIEIAPGIVTPGTEDTPRKAKLLQLPDDLTGKRVLDVGAYDGYFSFEAERRGAAFVLAYDHLYPDNTGFATAKKLLNSRVEYCVGSVYDLDPAKVGEFDVVFFLGVIYHLRHPLLALERLRSVCRGHMYLESHVTRDGFEIDGKLHTSPEIEELLRNLPIAVFYPGGELNNDPTNWWSPTRLCLEQMIRSHGFEPSVIAEWDARIAFRCERTVEPLPFYVWDQ